MFSTDVPIEYYDEMVKELLEKVGIKRASDFLNRLKEERRRK